MHAHPHTHTHTHTLAHTPKQTQKRYREKEKEKDNRKRAIEGETPTVPFDSAPLGFISQNGRMCAAAIQANVKPLGIKERAAV